MIITMSLGILISIVLCEALVGAASGILIYKVIKEK